jgi:hypothetical protein
LRQASITEINTSHIIDISSSLDRIASRQIDPLGSSERVNREIQSFKLTQLEYALTMRPKIELARYIRNKHAG